MRRRNKIILAGILCSMCFVFSGLADQQKAMSVQVKEGQLRNSPSFLGAIIANTFYGDRVEILQDQGAWKMVAVGGIQGWMHSTALTTKTIVLKAGAKNVRTSTTSGEIALAGKGFNEEVEKQYKKHHQNLDYTWVERMEAIQVSPEQMQDFLKQGSLVPAEGGV